MGFQQCRLLPRFFILIAIPPHRLAKFSDWIRLAISPSRALLSDLVRDSPLPRALPPSRSRPLRPRALFFSCAEPPCVATPILRAAAVARCTNPARSRRRVLTRTYSLLPSHPCSVCPMPLLRRAAVASPCLGHRVPVQQLLGKAACGMDPTKCPPIQLVAGRGDQEGDGRSGS